jgi:hypothetical protein
MGYRGFGESQCFQCLVTASSGDSSGTDFNRLKAATGLANGMGLSLL